MTQKTAYQTDDKGKFVSEICLDESPLEPGVFLIPAGAVIDAPPACGVGQHASFRDGAWKIVDDVLIDAPPFSVVVAAYLATVRAIREQVLNRLAGIGFAALLASDTAVAMAAATARQALLDITVAPAVLAATDIEGMTTAMKAAYAAIIAAAPPVIREAFDTDAA